MNSGKTRKLGMGQFNRSISDWGKVFPVLVIGMLFMVGGGTGLATAEHKFSEEEPEFVRARRDMVETQIKARGIKDKRLLMAMLKVKRHLFVPAHIQKLAYGDHPFRLGQMKMSSQAKN